MVKFQASNYIRATPRLQGGVNIQVRWGKQTVGNNINLLHTMGDLYRAFAISLSNSGHYMDPPLPWYD